MHASALWALYKSFARRVAAGVGEERVGEELHLSAATSRRLRPSAFQMDQKAAPQRGKANGSMGETTLALDISQSSALRRGLAPCHRKERPSPRAALPISHSRNLRIKRLNLFFKQLYVIFSSQPYNFKPVTISCDYFKRASPNGAC